METAELTNMVMVYSLDGKKAVVQRRTKSWKGVAFPGGHVEPGESFVQSAIREIREETGLEITNLRSCGMVHWCQSGGKRYLVFLYKTCDYLGELLPATEEGEVWWEEIEQIPNLDLCSHFKDYLTLFLQGEEKTYSEAFGDWDDESKDIVFW